MTIVSRDGIISALGNNNSPFVIDKASVANAVAGQYFSLWRATGVPGQGAIPGTTPAIPTSATLGAASFLNQTNPATSYLDWAELTCGIASTSVEFLDRVAHMGGLVLNVTTTQTITGLDLAAGGLNLGAARRGLASYGEIQWWLEVYSDGGATAANATINVTFNDGSTGNLASVAVGGTIRAGRAIPLGNLIAAADSGKFIRGINNVVLSASTGTAGNFGFTATRLRASMSCPQSGKKEIASWAQLGRPEIVNDSCLMLMALCGGTSTGTVRGAAKITHG